VSTSDHRPADVFAVASTAISEHHENMMDMAVPGQLSNADRRCEREDVVDRFWPDMKALPAAAAQVMLRWRVENGLESAPADGWDVDG
jgi:hypothetical protein